jgi:hypothetical protein
VDKIIILLKILRGNVLMCSKVHLSTLFASGKFSALEMILKEVNELRIE